MLREGSQEADALNNGVKSIKRVCKERHVTLQNPPVRKKLHSLAFLIAQMAAPKQFTSKYNKAKKGYQKGVRCQTIRHSYAMKASTS